MLGSRPTSQPVLLHTPCWPGRPSSRAGGAKGAAQTQVQAEARESEAQALARHQSGATPEELSAAEASTQAAGPCPAQLPAATSSLPSSQALGPGRPLPPITGRSRAAQGQLARTPLAYDSHHAVEGGAWSAPPPDPAAAHAILTPGGLVLAATALLSARLGRLRARWDAFDPASATARVEEAWRQRAGARGPAAGEAVDPAVRARIEAARQRAAAQAAERAEQERARREVEDQEIARIAAQRDARRAAYSEEEARLKRELAERTEREVEALREARALAAEAAAQRRREEEAAAEQRRKEAEAAAAAEAAARAAEAAAAAEARRRLRATETVFAVRLSGTARAEQPPPGTTVGERVRKPATVRLACALGSPLAAPPGEPLTADAPGLDEAREGAWGLAAAAAQRAAQGHLGGLRLQAVGGQGALTTLDELEAEHWLRGAAVRAASAAAAQLRELAQGLQASGRDQEAEVQVRTPMGVLPQRDDPRRLTARLDRVAALCGEGDEVGAAAALSEAMEDQEGRLTEDAPAALPRHAGAALTAAAFLERASASPLAGADVGDGDAARAALGEAAQRVALGLLREATLGAPPDSLGPLATAVGAVIPEGSPVGPALAGFAEANLSPAARAARDEKRRRFQAELAAALVAEEWPEDAATAADRAAAREAVTPIAERAWALRNVAATQALGGSPSELARARQLLERAVLLKGEWLGRARHPGALPELVQLRGVLERVPEWAPDAAAVGARALTLLRDVAERYAACGEEGSAAAVLEAALKDGEERLGLRHPAVRAAEDRVAQLLETMPAETKAKVVAARRGGGALAAVLAAFTEEPAARAAAGVATEKILAWDTGGLAPLAPLL